MPATLDAIIQNFLATQKTPSDILVASMAVLSLQLAPEVLKAGLLPALSKNYVFCAGIIPKVENDAHWMRRSDIGLTICMKDPTKLLFHALDIAVKSHGLPLCIGLSYGEGIIIKDQEWVGIARFQAERLAQLGSHHQVLASTSLVHSLGAVPDGIGALPLNRSTQELIGFPVVAIRDFR